MGWGLFARLEEVGFSGPGDGSVAGKIIGGGGHNAGDDPATEWVEQCGGGGSAGEDVDAAEGEELDDRCGDDGGDHGETERRIGGEEEAAAEQECGELEEGQ